MLSAMVAVAAAFLVAVAISQHGRSPATRRSFVDRQTDGFSALNAYCVRVSDVGEGACPTYDVLEAAGAVPRTRISLIEAAPGIDMSSCARLCVGVPVRNENMLTFPYFTFDVPPMTATDTYFVVHQSGDVMSVPARTDAATRVTFNSATGKVLLVP